MENRDNQQVTETDLAWLAGIIDGEGSISMNVRKKTWNGWNGIGVDLSVNISNTDSGIIHKCQCILDNMDISSHIFESECNPIYSKNGIKYNTNKTMMRISVSKMKNILSLLTILQKYLAGEKRTRALLISKFIQRRLDRKNKTNSKSGNSWYDKYDWDTVKEFYKITGGRLLPEVSEILNEHTLSTQ